MAVKYSDRDIDTFLRETKRLPSDYRTKIQLQEKRGHKQRELDVQGSNGNNFRLILRQNNFNVLDFSIILAIVPSDSSRLFRLRRYNGRSHEHTNHVEAKTFYEFHIHMATERYQELGTREDAYAESTDRYTDFHSALKCMLSDCAFEVQQEPQQSLFGED